MRRRGARRYPWSPVENAPDPMPPARRAPRRQRRFTLPADHHDQRTSERIEAFLEGPPPPVRKRVRSSPMAARRPHRPVVFDDTAAWNDAVRREEVRIDRYGRRATLMVVDVGSHAPDGLTGPVPAEALVEPVIDAIRNEARETDRVVRTNRTRFHLLLPETVEADAHLFADRLAAACSNRVNGHGAALRLRIESVTPELGRPLEDALDELERRLAD